MKIGSAEKNLNGPKPETTMLTQAIETERDKNPPNHDQVIELGNKINKSDYMTQEDQGKLKPTSVSAYVPTSVF